MTYDDTLRNDIMTIINSKQIYTYKKRNLIRKQLDNTNIK
jgi:hypothetical protein